MVAMALVECERRQIVDGSLQFHRAAAARAKPLLGRPQKQGSDPETAGGRKYVNSNDVATVMRRGFSHNEPGDCRPRIFSPAFESGIDLRQCIASRDQSECAAPSHIKAKLGTGIGNSGRKAGLVDAPERVEVGCLEVADGKWHRAIVMSGVLTHRFPLIGPSSRNATAICLRENCLLASPQPPDVPSHQRKA